MLLHFCVFSAAAAAAAAELYNDNHPGDRLPNATRNLCICYAKRYLQDK